MVDLRFRFPFVYAVKLTFLFMFLICSRVQALSTAPIFTDNMVLQRNKSVRIWGTTKADGVKVTVEFAGQSHSATSKDKQWSVKLKPMKMSAEGRVFNVKSAEGNITYKNVLVGDVWFAGGQSNMQMEMRGIPGGPEEIAKNPIDQIRFIIILRTPKGLPPDLPNHNPVTWYSPTEKTAKAVSAVPYYFARAVYEKTKVPIGIINCNFGSTPVETWMSEESLKADPEGAKVWKKYEQILAKKTPEQYDKERDEYVVGIKNFWQKLREWKKDGSPKGKKPKRPEIKTGPYCKKSPAVLFNSMVKPLIPYDLKGFIWYQGESNALNAEQYESLFGSMIKDWRQHWGDAKLPFYFVQIAAIDWSRKRIAGKWPIVRQAQYNVWQKVPHTGMVVSIDTAERKNIHPKAKKPIGERLARFALHNDYRMADVKTTGPKFSEQKINGSSILVTFKNSDKGLKGKGEVKGFEIAGADKKYLPAQAKIIGNNQVELSNPQITNPQFVRYGWKNWIECNLLNGEGLPAIPFSTEK